MGANTELGQITRSVQEVASALSVSEDTVRRMCEQGTLPAIRIGRRILILEQGLMDRVLRASGDPAAVAEAEADAVEVAAMQVANEQRQREAEAQFRADREANNKRSGVVNPMGHIFRV